MAWSHRNTATTTFTSATDPLTGITRPTTVDGDVLEMDVHLNSDTTTITTPSGWTLIRDTALSGRALRFARFRRIASGESGTYTVDLSAAQRAVVHVTAYSGLDTSGDPVDVESGATDDTLGTTLDAPTVTTTLANDLVSVGYSAANPTTFTQDTSPSVTERADADAGGASPAASKGDFNQASAGATGAVTATVSSTRGIGHTTAYKEATATGATGTLSTGSLSVSGQAITGVTGVVGTVATGSLAVSGQAASATTGAAAVVPAARRRGTGRWALLITDQGSDEANPRVIPINGGSFSWLVNDTGTANVEVMTKDLLDAGLLPPWRLGGKWATWRHPTLGHHRGVVTAPDCDIEGETTEIVWRSWDFLLDGRRTPRLALTGAATAGAVVKRSIEDRDRGSHPLRLDVTADEQGDPIPANNRAADLRALLRDVVRTADVEYRVSHSGRTVEVRPRVGQDRSASVVLIEGKHVVGGRVGYDLESISNEVLAVPADTPYGRARGVTVRDEDNIAVHGLRQTTVVFAGQDSRARLRSSAEAVLTRLTRQGHVMTLTLADEDSVWAGFADGDSVTVLLPSVAVRARVRCLARHYDLDDDQLRCVFRVEEYL